MHDYIPDFILRLKSERPRFLVLETKGFDNLEEIKSAAAERWVNAVNAEGSFGEWIYRVAKKQTEVQGILNRLTQSVSRGPSSTNALAGELKNEPPKSLQKLR
jgi:type III restriction enzyme